MTLTLKEVYEKYALLDRLLSDPEWAPHDPTEHALRDLWLAVKAEVTKEDAA